jgi:phosphoribosylaminoimidazolecarboxamide formyltransferase/IMP cyclohydrolase
VKVARALVSVSDKAGVVDFCRALAALGVQILSTGGTAKSLKDAGVPVVEVSAYTGFPEMLDGRVKTLHPKIHGGILGLRDKPEHVAKMQAHGIEPIDLVAVNLYPFEKTVASAGCTLEEAVEQIDIGGPCMIRASAKNHRFVTVVVDPADYAGVLAEMDRLSGEVSAEFNFKLAVKAFLRTAQYDSAISGWLGARG